jgi:hypothetical protein
MGDRAGDQGIHGDLLFGAWADAAGRSTQKRPSPCDGDLSRLWPRHRHRFGCADSEKGLAELYDVNPLTAAKAYGELQREGLVEAIRGEGLMVRNGVRVGLMKRERAKFMKEEWPALRMRLARLEVDVKMLLATAAD